MKHRIKPVQMIKTIRNKNEKFKNEQMQNEYRVHET